MKKAPPQVMNFIKNPETFNETAFETAMRNEVEILKGKLSASEELLVGMLVMTVKTLVDAHKIILAQGYIEQYSAGPAMSPWIKVRTECLDKSVKILKELALMNKTNRKPSEVDELFETA